MSSSSVRQPWHKAPAVTSLKVAILWTLLPASTFAQSAPLDRLSSAFSTPVSYRVEYDLAGPVLDATTDQRLRSLQGQVAPKYIEDRGRSLLVGFVGRITVRDVWTLRKEQHSPLLGGRAERAGTIDIFTKSYEGHANRADSSRATARNVRTLSVPEQIEALARRIHPFEFERAEASYLFLGTFLAERLKAASDLKVIGLDAGRICLSSEQLGVSATIDPTTGQLQGAALGSEAYGMITNYEFDDFFEEELFPARHPGVARQSIVQFQDGKALPPKEGMVVRYRKVESCPQPAAEEFDIRKWAEQVFDAATGKPWQPPNHPEAPQVTPTSFGREGTPSARAKPQTPTPSIRPDGRLEPVSAWFGPTQALYILGGTFIFGAIVVSVRRVRA